MAGTNPDQAGLVRAGEVADELAEALRLVMRSQGRLIEALSSGPHHELARAVVESRDAAKAALDAHRRLRVGVVA